MTSISDKDCAIKYNDYDFLPVLSSIVKETGSSNNNTWRL